MKSKKSEYWSSLPEIDRNLCDKKYIEILNTHGFADVSVVVPLQARYTKGRAWTPGELKTLEGLWRDGFSLTFIAAKLNRNPQDIIYKFIRGPRLFPNFSQKGRSEGAFNWTNKVQTCAEELFEGGLPAWKIAALFQTDFEYVEKKLYGSRGDYGHKKKNPFALHTNHKESENKRIVEGHADKIDRALELFCGEGKVTKILEDNDVRTIVAIDNDERALKEAKLKCNYAEFIHENNEDALNRLTLSEKKFDLIDVDPFTTCFEQVPQIWNILAERAFVGITLGGEYRRCFIGSNRKAIKSRYGFYSENMPNDEYLNVFPSYFLGWVADQAAKNAFTFSVLSAYRYANICRFWLCAERSDNTEHWLRSATTSEFSGKKYKDLDLVRFAEIKQRNTAQRDLFNG